MGLTQTSSEFSYAEDFGHNAEADTPKTGASEPDAPVWGMDRTSQLNRFVGPGDYTDKSSYPTPKGLVGSDGFNFAGPSDESKHGKKASGEALTQDDGPLNGTVSIYSVDNGSILSDKNIQGSFTIVASAPQGVTDGKSYSNTVNMGNLGVKFRPSFSGLSYKSEGVSEYHTIKYSGVEGYINNAEGDPVKSVPVIGSGDSAVTNEEGYYSLLAPQNTSVELASIEKTETKNVTVGEGSYETLDWQFSGIRIRVLTNLYEPISGAPVEIDGERHVTNEDGEVVFPLAGHGQEYNIRVFDSDDFTDTVVAPDEGGVISTTMVGTPESNFSGGVDGGDQGPYSISVRVLDNTSNEPVKNIGAYIKGYGIRTTTGATGYAKLVIPSSETGEETLVVGAESKRYRKNDVTIQLDENETVTDTIYLKREIETVNF